MRPADASAGPSAGRVRSGRRGSVLSVDEMSKLTRCGTRANVSRPRWRRTRAGRRRGVPAPQQAQWPARPPGSKRGCCAQIPSTALEQRERGDRGRQRSDRIDVPLRRAGAAPIDIFERPRSGLGTPPAQRRPRARDRAARIGRTIAAERGGGQRVVRGARPLPAASDGRQPLRSAASPAPTGLPARHGLDPLTRGDARA